MKIYELPDGERIVKNIEKGEQGIESRRTASEVVSLSPPKNLA